MKTEKYRALDFLDKYLEFKGMTPNYEEWNEEALKDNPPRLYRFKQLKALMKAFEIGENLKEDFENGIFLENRNPKIFTKILDDIDIYVSQSEFEQKSSRAKRDMDRFQESIRMERGMIRIFQKFFQFIETTKKFLEFNNNWLSTGSIPARYTIYRTKLLIKSIDTSKLDEIKELISQMIDPKQQEFTFEELVQNYDYPNVDLSEIDADYS
jgi:hypothetical protein